MPMTTTTNHRSAEHHKCIFHVITHLDVGGAERVAINIAKSATPGIEYHIVEVIRAHTPFTQQLLDELRSAGIGCHRFFMPDIKFHFVFERIAALLFPLWFLPLCIRFRPDVIHTHTEVPDMSVCAFLKLFSPLFRCQVVRTVHNTRLWTGQQRLANIIEPFYQRLHACVAISESVRKSYLHTYGKKLPIIHNGVAATAQQPYPGLRQHRINVLFAGRLEPQKGVSHLIEVVRHMANDNRYFFHIAGEGSLKPMVSQALSDVGNATLTPPIYQLSSYLSSFDCLFMPSEFEGLSILSIEASLAALPVVANNCPGLGDTLPPDWQLKVNGNNLDAYLHLFGNVIPSADMAAMGKQAQDYATHHFGITQMQRAYERLYGCGLKKDEFY